MTLMASRTKSLHAHVLELLSWRAQNSRTWVQGTLGGGW